MSSAAETSFVNESFSDSPLEQHDNDDDDKSEPASFSRSDKPPLRKKLKIVKPPHKKSEKIKFTTHDSSAVGRGLNASITAQDNRFERQLKANAERERSLSEFRASEAGEDRQHEARMAQSLMSLKSSHPPPQYWQSSSMPFFAWGGLHNVSQSNSVMPSHHSRQLSNVTLPARTDVWLGRTNISMVPSSCQSLDPYQPVNSD